MMSDWSSFEQDKLLNDAWKKYLSENNIENSDLDEGRLADFAKSAKGAFKKIGQAGPEATKKRIAQQGAAAKKAGRSLARTADQLKGQAKAPADAEESPPELTPKPTASSADDETAAGSAQQASQIPKETPLSITKKQKGVKAGSGGQTEMPLVMQLQKMGLSQQTSQQIAKRLGQYLQQRKLAVAEAIDIIKEALVAEKLLIEKRIKVSDKQRETLKAAAKQAGISPGEVKRVKKIKGLRGKSTLIAVNKAGDVEIYTPDSADEAQQHAAAGQADTAPAAEEEPDFPFRQDLVNKGSPESVEEPAAEEPAAEEPAAKEYDTSTTIKNVKGSVRSHLMKLIRSKEETKKKGSQYALGLQQAAKSGNPSKMLGFLSTRYTGWGGAEGLKDLPDDDVKDLMSWALKDDVVRKYAKLGYEYRQGKAQEKAKARGDIRSVGADKSPVGKIISRFVSDNQALVAKDPKLKAIFSDPTAFNKFQKSVKTGLARQLKRRGYNPEEFGNILESVLNDSLNESKNEKK